MRNTSGLKWRQAFGHPGVIQHLEDQRVPTQQAMASLLCNYISSGMFKSLFWKGPLLISSLPAEALDTFSARRIINLLPLCLHPILDNSPCMVKKEGWERKRERAHPATAPGFCLFLHCWHMHMDGHKCPWASHNNKGSVTALHTHASAKQLQADQATPESILFPSGSFQSHLKGESPPKSP